MNRGLATADRLARCEALARRAVERSPRNAAKQLVSMRGRLQGIREHVIEPAAGESPSLLEDKIEAFEEAFGDAVRCTVCGLHLTDKVSVKRTMGPDCWARLQKSNAAVEGRRSTNEESP